MKRGLKFLLWLTVLSLVIALVGCGPQNDAGGNPESESESSAGAYPVQLKDDTGTTVTVKKEPKRIISLIPSMTETVYALQRGDRLVGVTTNDDYPPEVKKVEKVGDMKINVEKVVSLKPDLVLASMLNGEETIDKLRKMGLTVYVADPQNLKGVYDTIREVGQAANARKEAEKVISRMEKEKEKAQKIASRVPEKDRVQVWVEISPDLFTAGGDTFMNELITLAGGKNVAEAQKGWPQVSAEKVVKWNPDVILFTHGDQKQIQSRDGWKNIDAVKKGRIVALDTNLVSRPGPRVTQGLLEISKALYPKWHAEAK